MASTRKITLKSSDGEAFEVDEAVALESQTIKHMIEDDCADSGIPLPNVTSKILAKVIEYCKKHVDAANSEEKPSEEDLKAWDADFVKVDQATLFDLILVSFESFGFCFLVFGLLMFYCCVWCGDLGVRVFEIGIFVFVLFLLVLVVLGASWWGLGFWRMRIFGI